MLWLRYILLKVVTFIIDYHIRELLMSFTFTGNTPNGVKAFRTLYRRLRRASGGRHALELKKMPLFLTEGDSWFSLPIHHNIVDFLELGFKHGVFLRLEESGDVLSSILGKKSKKKLLGYSGDFKFDAVLISGGGNDLVDELELVSDSGAENISVDETFNILNSQDFFERMRRHYQTFAEELHAVDGATRIFSHTYDYPRLIGVPMGLTLENIGLAGLIVKEIGSWIGPKIKKALPRPNDQLQFVTLLIDTFERDVLARVNAPNFHYVDLRGTLTLDSDWNDEMHPSEDAYRKLAEKYQQVILGVLGGRYRGLDVN